MSPRNRKPVQSFDDALRLLNHELENLNLQQPLQIRAIGGYALLKHGIRTDERALTSDIDTMTQDYSAGVQEAIRTVAARVGLDPDWINNDNLGGNDPEDIEALYDAQWERQDMGLRNIEVSVADVPTLTRSKIMAADAAGLAADRAQDAPDLLELLRHQGITTLREFRRRYPDPFDEFPVAGSIVSDHFQRDAQSRTQRAGGMLLDSISGALDRGTSSSRRMETSFDDLDASIDDHQKDDDEFEF